MSEIETFLSENAKSTAQISVVGDIMVDEYYDIIANRVSPEFPIPVLLSGNQIPTARVLGGAGNLCKQFQHFNAEVSFFGFIDDDVESILASSGIDYQYAIKLPLGAKVPIKKRLYNGNFPLCRWDIERTDYGLSQGDLWALRTELQDRVTKNAKGILVFSDYNKGVYDSLSWASRDDLLSIVDPKKGPIDKWRGCTIFKPNAQEAEELSGEKDWHKQCDFFRDKLDCTAVIITQGKHGVFGKVLDDYFEYRPRKEVVAESVVGAGDCFMAFLAMTQAYNMNIFKAIEIAWDAGAVYVQKKYNSPIAPYDLLKYIDPIKAKLVNANFLRKSNRDFKLVFTNGCFDIMHAGHLTALQFAKSNGDKLVVAVNSDASVKKIKGENRPIVPIAERKQLLASLEVVDFVVDFDDDTPYNVIREIEPDIICKSGDYLKDVPPDHPKYVVGSDIAEVIIAPYIQGHSTTNIVERIKNG
jgi:D-beta-D-heptose 7-phosphate kinase/D-beta-D-heptose 1-phosphate adenosyltransferase